MNTQYFLSVEDLCRASIGPFVSAESAQAHYDWTKSVGDGAELIGIRKDAHDPDADLCVTPEEDKASDRS